MPLETSPVDGSPMRHVCRYGVEIDVCPSSGGIWLDKGELEKLVDFLREAVEAEKACELPGSRTRQREYEATHILGIFDDI